MPVEPNEPNPVPLGPLPVREIGLHDAALVEPTEPPPNHLADAPGSSSITESSSPVPVAAPAMAIRFCRTCGASWEADWTECPHCADSRNRQLHAAGAETVFRTDQRRVRAAIALYFCLLGVSVVSMIIVMAIGKAQKANTQVVIGAEIAMAIITLAWCVPFHRDLLPLLTRVPRPRWFVFAVLIALGTMLLAQGAVGLLHQFLGVPEIGYLKNLAGNGYGFGWAVLIICAQPAIIEELAFRGVILTSLEPVIGAREALWVSALMFAILHLSIPSFPHLLVLGIVLAWLRQRTGSMYAGMLTHFTHNLLVLLVEHYRSLLPW